MAFINIDDVKFRKSQLDDNLITLDQLVTTFQQKTRATGELQKTQREAEDSLGALETKGKDADSAAETYDREFLDRKQDSGDQFVQKKNPTIQDFTLDFFWVSYLLFCADKLRHLIEQYFCPSTFNLVGVNSISHSLHFIICIYY